MINPFKRRLSSFVVFFSLIVLSVLFFFPLLLTFSNSLNPWFTLPTILPVEFHWDNYRLATTMLDFWRYTQNSVILCALTLFTTTFTSGLVGYAFSRIDVPGKKALFMIILSTMMLPGIVTQIPTYILLHKYNLLDSYVPWLIWGLGGSPLYIFLYRQFFSSIPKELEEAARIDGCSIFRTYWNIFLPLSIPAMVTVAIMSFQTVWGDIIGPFMFLSDAKYTLATALSTINYTLPQNKAVVIQQVSAAASILFMIPVIVSFFIGQRFLIDGVVSSGVKG